jgi:NADPH2:quinone reductase
MRSARQVIVDRFGGPDVLKIVDVSIASPRPGQIMVRVEAAGVLYGDITRRTNRYLTETPLPYAPGTEIAGTVVEIGQDVTAPKVGDRVHCRVGSQGYAQYALVEANHAIPLPDAIGFAEATTLLVQGLTAYLLTHDVATLRGKSVFIESAAGGVGIQVAQMAKAQGASFVVGSASSEEKREYARRSGVDLAVSSVESGWSGQVLEATHGRGVDVAYELSGAAFAELLKCLAPFGTLVKLGRAVNEHQSFAPSQLVGKNFAVRGFYLPGYSDGAHLALLGEATRSLIDSVLSGRLKVDVGHRFPMNEVGLAHRAIEERRTVGKVVLEPWSV